MRDFLGDGLFLASASKWASRRKVLAPAFHFKCLENFVEIMDRNSEIMVKKLRKVADGKTPVDLFNYVSLEALDVITGIFIMKNTLDIVFKNIAVILQFI